MSETQTAKIGLLFSRDLMFISRVTGTASQIGKSVEVSGQLEDVAIKAADEKYGCLFIDLSIPALNITELVSRVKRPGLRLVAFGAHVQTEQLALAESAGCDEVHPRSRFSAQLPQILQQSLS